MFLLLRRNLSRTLLAVASSLVWLGMAIPVHAQGPDPATELYVNDIIVGWRYFHNGKLPYVKVDIEDGYGNPVNGALVVGDWSGCNSGRGAADATETVCTTDPNGTTVCVDGRAIVWGKNFTCKKNKRNCSFVFTITYVQKSGMTYVPEAAKTTDSFTSLCQ